MDGLQVAQNQSQETIHSRIRFHAGWITSVFFGSAWVSSFKKSHRKTNCQSPIKRYREKKCERYESSRLKLMTYIQEVRMPEGAKILTVATQFGYPCIWAMVETENKPVYRKFRTYGTGHPIKEYAPVYVGTYLIQGDSLVFHVYETF